MGRNVKDVLRAGFVLGVALAVGALFAAPGCSSSYEYCALLRDSSGMPTSCICNDGDANHENGELVDSCDVSPSWTCCTTRAGYCSCSANPDCSGGDSPSRSVPISECKLDSPSDSTSQASSGGGACPDPAYTECTNVADCECSAACGKNATNESVSYCTLPCTQDSDCSASPTWHGSSVGCNPLTGYCTQ